MTDGDRMALRARQLGAEMLSTLPPRWSHIQAVARRAEEFSAGMDATDRHMVVAAAWLHDIGYADGLAVTDFHALDGARYLARTGWPNTICGLVAFHTGATYEAEERDLTEALSEFEPPPPHLLDTLTAADISVSPDGVWTDPRERITEILERYDDDDPVHRAVRRSAPELLASVDRTERRLALTRQS